MYVKRNNVRLKVQHKDTDTYDMISDPIVCEIPARLMLIPFPPSSSKDEVEDVCYNFVRMLPRIMILLQY